LRFTAHKRRTYFSNISVRSCWASAWPTIQKPAGPDGMLHVARVCCPFQVLEAIVELVRVFMVDYLALWPWSMKRFADQDMHRPSSPAEIHGKVFIREASRDIGASAKLVFQDSAHLGSSACFNPAHPSAIGNFVKPLKSTYRLPDLFRHRGGIVAWDY